MSVRDEVESSPSPVPQDAVSPDDPRFCFLCSFIPGSASECLCSLCSAAELSKMGSMKGRMRCGAFDDFHPNQDEIGID